MDQKKQLFDQQTEHLLRIQRDLGIALSSTGNLSEVLKLVLAALFQTGSVDAGCIYFFGDTLEDIALESSKGFSPSFIEAARLDLFEDEIFSHLSSGNSFYGNFDKIKSPFGVHGQAEGMRSFGIIPFLYEKKTLGALSIASRSEGRIPPHSRLVFETIAARLAGIINRVKSEDSLKKMNRVLENLNSKITIEEQRYRSIVEDLTDLVSRFLPDGTITFINNAYSSYFKGSKENFIGKSHFFAIHDDDKERAMRHLASLGKNKPFGNIELRVILPDGKIRWVDWTDRAIFTDNSVIAEYQSVGRDITDKKELQEKLEFLGMHDALTGLYNRAYFDEEIKRLSSSRFLPVGVVVCDLNGLKIVNDALGHQKGDLLLSSASTVLKQCFRDTDIVARIGGDEFAVILPNTAEQSLLHSIDRIKKMIKEIREHNPDIPLSLAIGYAVRTKANVTLESAFSEADDRMYHEKEIQRDFTRGLVLTTLMHELSKIDEYRGTHMLRVRDLSLSIGRALSLNEHELEKLQLASRYHDIGMIGVDMKAINKADSLSAEDHESIQRHPEIGSRIAEAHPFLRDISDVILKHHEWWNGKGYPKKLAGEEIPLLARIITVADAFDSMTNNPYYRPALSREEAFSVMQSQAGSQFDPAMVEILLSIA